ncbi:hypothetical protein Hrd1104_08415 [Halorhabdus sp. CBA1104]|uniref:DedA family protein n=1 Tax=unclassified Halorhabdus TaxID=2621901 RepID=UPI0012B3304B|nr:MULTISPECIES: VTT domain-containing protein [unclassified Halorhabdus]QGN07325.1 hypothetical protein Hrd1104_08415 [Halorhabdus sp. CBA1104]
MIGVAGLPVVLASLLGVPGSVVLASGLVGLLGVVAGLLYRRTGRPTRASIRQSISTRVAAVIVLATVGAALVVLFVLEFDFFALPTQTTGLARGLLRDYGLIALFVLFVIEGGQVLYFAPSESLVPAAVLLLADSPLGYLTIVLVSVVGATIGQCLLFSLAKYGGREYLLNARWFHVGEDRLARFEDWFGRWGPLAVPISNTLLFVRGLATVPAGLAGMGLRRFALLSALGTLTFEVILALATLGVVSAI